MTEAQLKDFVPNLRRQGRDASPEECEHLVNEVLEAHSMNLKLFKLCVVLIIALFICLIVLLCMGRLELITINLGFNE